MKAKVCSPRIFSRAIFAGILLLGSTFAFAQNTDSPAAARMRALNNSLLSLHGQMQQADANSARTLRSQAGNVIAQRAAALANLIQTDPRAALSFAFSPELLADLAAKFPQSALQLESHTTATGPVQHWIADDHAASRSWWTMNAGSQYLYLHFASTEPRTVNPGEVLQATGIVASSEMAVEASVIQSGPTADLGSGSQQAMDAKNTLGTTLLSSSSFFLLGLALWVPGVVRKFSSFGAQVRSLLGQLAMFGLGFALIIFTTAPVEAQNSCSTTGVQKVIAILATFPGVAPPATLTPQSVSDMFFGATAPSLNSYWQEASYGTTSATGDVFGWYTLTGTYSNASCQSLSAVQSDAMSAAAASGANFQNYDRVVVIFPDVLGCGWSGLSSIGCASLNTPSGTINASSSYLSATYASVEVITHELGHGLGLAHASSRGFTDGSSAIPLGPLGASGNLTEYGDKFSSMSCCTGNLGGEYAAPHKAEILGWLPPTTGYQTVQTSGTYTLQPYETPGGLKAIKVQRGTGNNAWLWVEYRQSDGSYDTPQMSGGAFPSPVNTFLSPQPYSGALVHYEDSTTGLYTHLINYTPADSSFFTPALLAGQSWSDPYTDVSLSVLSATSSGLTVDVNYGPTPCTAAAPAVIVSPLNPSIYPGQSAGYTATVTNNDSSGCPASTINVGSTAPSGWSTSMSASSITLTPGQSASLTMSKGAPSGTPAGTYAVNLTAANTSLNGSGAANATVMAPPSLTVNISTPGASFVPPTTVPITASVQNGGVPASGASVTFMVTGPSGGAATQNASTGSNGVATWNYKLNGKSLPGTYSAVAQATLSSGNRKSASTAQRTTSNTTTFTIQ